MQQQIEQLSNDNYVLKTAFITQKEQIEKIKLERSKFVDVIIDTAKGYGLVCDSCLFSLINDYDNKRISYDELLEKLQNDVIIELQMAIDDLRNGELSE